MYCTSYCIDKVLKISKGVGGRKGEGPRASHLTYYPNVVVGVLNFVVTMYLP